MRSVLIPEHIAPSLSAAGGTVITLQGATMGTTWSVRAVAGPEADAAHWQLGIQRELDNVVAQMSHWLEDSDLGRFNRAPAGSWHALPTAFFDVLTYALHIAEQTDGACDPTAGALVNLWGFGPVGRYDEAGFALPAPAPIAAARALGGWQRLQVDALTRRIYQPGGLQLDLSAVAKGYGVDCVANFLEQHGISHYLVEVGGELCGAGTKPDQQPWWVELEQPEQTGIPAPVVALHGLAVATSGDYRRVYRAGDQRLPHTIDPRSGYPIDNAVASVTVLHASCMAADALSTALTVLGAIDGIVFADQQRLAARFLVRTAEGLAEYRSQAYAAMLQ